MPQLQTKEYTAIGVLVVVLVVAYSQGLFSKDRGKNVNPNTAAQDGSTPTLSNNQYDNKATTVHTSLQGYLQGFGGDLWTILADLDALNDSDLIQVANAYSRLYPNDEYPTLYSIIQSTTAFYFSETYTLKYEVLARLKKLGV